MTLTQNFWVIGHKIEPINTSGEYDAFIGETPSGVPGPPPHYHSKYAELFLVLKGKMEFMVDGEKRLLHEGESIDLPPGSVHTFSNPTSEPVRWLNIHSPKGFSSFFEKFGVPSDEENAFQSSVSESMIGQVVSEAASFDMNIIQTDS
jgi:mannose-6-phosphate isomerase-like protein (cupin superfamily)